MNKTAAKKKPGSKKQKDLHGRIQSATEALGKMTFAGVMDEIKKSAEGGDAAAAAPPLIFAWLSGGPIG